jgi:hypothetical protein
MVNYHKVLTQYSVSELQQLFAAASSILLHCCIAERCTASCKEACLNSLASSIAGYAFAGDTEVQFKHTLLWYAYDAYRVFVC